MKISLKLSAVLLVGLMAAAPLALAHSPARPNLTCQSDTTGLLPAVAGSRDGGAFHDFAAGTGRTVGQYQDGNVEDCTGSVTYGMFLFSDDECAGSAGIPPGNVLPPDGDPFNLIKATDPSPVYTVACQTDRPADWDGDYDWAVGGAVLAARGGAISQPPAQSCGGANGITVTCDTGAYGATDLNAAADGMPYNGANYCWDMAGHHSAPGDVFVAADPAQISAWVSVTVTSNYRRAAADGLPTETQGCGDTVVEPCTNSGTSIDQVNCNGRDCKEEVQRALLPSTGVITVSHGCEAGQGGVLIVFVGSLGCPISALTTADVVACTQPQSAAVTGHIWSS